MTKAPNLPRADAAHTKGLELAGTRQRLRVAANEFAHLIRLGRVPKGWVEDSRGACRNVLGCNGTGRRFRRVWFVPLGGVRPSPMGSIHSTPELCVVCAVRMLAGKD